MLRTVRAHRIQIALVFAVFLLFLAHAAGLFEMDIRLDGDLRFHDLLLAPLFSKAGPHIPAVIRSPEFLVLLGVGVTMSLLLPLLAPIPASLLTFAAMFPVFYVSYAQTTHRLLIPLEYSLLTLLIIFAVNVLLSYFSETHKKQKLIEAFGQYVPPQLVQSISRDPERFSLEGEARELSVMFCDVHGFTSISENLPPRQLTELLNALFTPLTEILYRHRGTIDKYMGDAVMAFWGAPVADPDHARNAILAAFDIQAMLRKMEPEFRRRGWPGIAMGVGINSGVMNVGNMGSRYRMAYTVIGDAVNLAARLQQLTRVYHGNIVVGENTRLSAPGLLYRELDLVQVKGKTRSARIFEPLEPGVGRGPEVEDLLRQHDQALERYYARDWDRAAELFRRLGQHHPGDRLYEVYLARIAALRDRSRAESHPGEVTRSVP